jgi:hypothetical protein
MRRTIVGLVVAASLFVGASRTLAKSPAATMEFNGWLLAAGIGFSSVEGTLTYEGRTYPVTVMGTSALALGASWTWGAAQVYGLQRLEDLGGVYDGAAFGASFVLGGHGGRYVSRGGVEVEIQLHSLGIDLQGAFERIRIVVHEKDGEPAPRHYWPGRSSIPPPAS